MEDAEIGRCRSFGYLSYIIQDNKEFIKDITNRIKTDWGK